MARRPSSLRRLPLMQPISRRLIQRVRGAHAQREVRPRPAPSLQPWPLPSPRAPPLRGRGRVCYSPAGGGGPAPSGIVRSATASSVCPLQPPLLLSVSLPASPGLQGPVRARLRRPRHPEAGNWAPGLRCRREHPARCRRWDLLPLQVRPAVAGTSHLEPPARLEAPPPRSPRRWRRYLAESWGRGRARGP